MTTLGATNSTTDYPTAAYISITTDEATAAGTAAIFDVFDEDNYGGTLSRTDNVTASGITFTPADGRFTVNVTGIYEITFTAFLSTNGITLDCNIIFGDSGAAFFTHPMAIHTAIMPTMRTITVIRSLTANDYINCFIDNVEADAITANAGCTLSMHKIN